METFSALRGLSQRQVMRSFDVSFDLRLNKRLSIELIRRWFETPLRSIWRCCDIVAVSNTRSCKSFWMTWKRFPVTGPYLRESTGHWWITVTKGQWIGFWCLLRYYPKYLVEQAVEWLVVWDSMTRMRRRCNVENIVDDNANIHRIIFHIIMG